MRHWLELKNEGDGAEDFLEKFKSEFEPVHVYVLTPQSKVIELPKGATSLDFAYAIHSEVGHRCRGARVDGRIVPLHQPLASGQTVEILTAKNASPSRDWLSPRLGYLKTSRARNRVRQWFKHQDYEHHVVMGRVSLDRELVRLGANEKPDLDKIAGRYNFQKGDDVLAAIGRGDLSAIQIAGSVGERKPARPKTRTQEIARKRPHAKGEVVVEGVENLLTHMARCCKPVPDDPIVGYLTRGRGVTIHRKDCPNVGNLEHAEQGRLIEVVWSEQPTETAYPVDVFISAADRKGLLRDVSSIFTNDDINVTGVSTATDHHTDVASMHFTVEIHSMEQLNGILSKVAQLPDVLEVRRRT
jgi:GTP pyrophosphokinase